jgi:hypothetical protein
MTTQADMMLMRALTMFGSGIGQGLDRRRQRKQNEEFADMIAPMSEPEDYMNPQDTQLIQALSGAVPGMAGMVSGAGMQGNQMLDASAASGQQNQQAQQLRAAMKDPQIAAMMKQGYAQAQLSNMMPQKPEVIQTNWGVFEKQPDGTLRTLTKPDEKKNRRVLKPGDILYDEDTGEVMARVPSDVKQKTWLSEESRMGENGVPEVRPTIIREDGTSVPAGPWGPASKAFGITTPVMGLGERAKWREKIEDTRKSLREFKEIKRMFDPDFLTMAGRARSGVGEVMSRFGVIDQFPGEKERYSDRNEFFAAVSDRANRYIKEITGAQMSEAEANRLLTAIPNVKDDPVAFTDKLNRVISVSEAALDQYEQVIWQTGSEDAARSAADRVVREMMGDTDSGGFVPPPGTSLRGTGGS